MKFGRKMMALVTVFLMVFGSMPFTALADSAYPYVYQGNHSSLSVISDTDMTMHYTALIELNYQPDGVATTQNVNVYCADISHVIKNEHFRTENMGSGSAANHLRAIMSSYVSLSKDLTAAERDQGTQAAIWHFTDGFDLDITSVDSNAAALYNALIDPGMIKGPVGTTDPADVTVQTVGVPGYNSDGTINITFRYKASDDDVSLTAVPSAGSLGSVTKDSGWNVVTVSNIPTNSDFTLTVSGPQTIHYDCMYFVPESGSGADPGQKLVGKPLNTTITVSATDTVQFGSLRLQKAFTDPADSTDHGENFSATVTGGPNNSVSITKSILGDGSWVTIAGLPYGNYTVRENLTDGQKDRYNLSAITSGGTITVNSPSQDVTITNCELGSLTIKKVLDGTPGNTTAFDFNIKGPGFDAGGENFSLQNNYTKSYDSLPYGAYVITETPKFGYSLTGMTGGTFDAGAHTCTVTVGAGSRDLTVTANNKELYGYIEVVKDDGHGNKLAGAVFTITDKDGNTADTLTTAAVTGEAKSKALPFGDYTLTETAAPYGYAVTFVPTTLTVNESEKVYSYNVSDQQLFGYIEVVKDDGHGKKLGGAVFTITDKDGNTADTLTTADGTGEAKSKPLPFGNYTLTETQAPYGYAVTFAPTGVAVNESEHVYTYNVSDTQLFGYVEVVKDDGHGNKLGGATFEIKDADGKVVDTLHTAAVTGEAKSKALPYGTYTLTETAPPYGYELNFSPISVKIDTSNHVYSFNASDTQMFGYIEVIKDDGHGNKLSGATFEIKDKDGNLVDTLHTAAVTGEAKSKALPFGDYTLTETVAPYGYAVTFAPQAVKVDAKDHIYSYNVSDRQMLGYIEVVKDDGHGNKLANAVFTITDKDGNLVDTLTTAAVTGEAKSKALPFGDYTLTETNAPFGYDITFAPQAVKVDTDAKVYTYNVSDRQLFGKIQVTKEDSATFGKLKGAEFSVSLAGDTVAHFNANIVAKITADASGDYISGDLPIGSYFLAETKAPDGYAIDDSTIYPVTVSANEVNSTLLPFKDTVYEGSITVTKLDAQHPDIKVPGVTFQCSSDPLFDSSKATVLEQVTGLDGTTTFKHLSVGVTYYVRETHQAAGYDIDVTDVKNVTVVFNTSMPLEFRNNELGHIQFQKLNADTFAPIAGAEFAISSKGGADFEANIIQRLTTDGTGYTPVSQALISGPYWVAETSAPSGYSNENATPWQVTVPFNELLSVGPMMDHQRFGSVSVQKDVTGEAGDTTPFTVRIQNQDNTYNHTVTLSQAEGVVTGSTAGYEFLSQLPYGTYTVSEENVPANFDKLGITIGGKSVTNNQFTIGDDTYSATIAIVATNRQHLGAVTVQKQVSGKTGDATKFTVRIHGVDVSFDHTVTLSQADGVITGATAGYAFLSQLPYGTYQVSEENVPANYDKLGITINGAAASGDQFKIDGSTYSTAIAIVAENQQRLGRVGVQKLVQGKTGDTTPFEIRIQGVDVDYDYTVTLTEADGVVTGSTPGYDFLSELTFGTYQVSEANSAGYDLAGITFGGKALTGSQFTIDESNYNLGLVITATNVQRLGSVSVQKVVAGKTGDTTPFTVRIQGVDVSYDHTVTLSQADGLVTGATAGDEFLSQLPYGTYQVSETGPATGFDKLGVTIDGATVADDQFTIGDDTYGAKIAIVATNVQRLGSVSVQKVVQGETGDTTPFTVRITGTGYDHSVTLSQADGVITGDTAGYEFLYQLPYGTYTVAETGVAPGYDALGITIGGKTTSGNQFTIDDSTYGATIAIVATNQQRMGSVSVQKLVQGKTGDTTKFTIHISGENYDHSVTLSQADGLITGATAGYEFLSKLPYGTYTVSEDSAANYTKLGVTIGGVTMPGDQFTIGDGTYNTTLAIVATNHKQAGWIQVVKLDSADYHPLKDAEFEVSTAGDTLEAFEANKVETITTGDSGVAETGELIPGTYYIMESKAPDGYAIDDSTIHELQVADGETNAMLPAFKDTVYEGSIVVTKHDAQYPDDTVPGITFQCSSNADFDSSKAAVYEQTTGADGTATFQHLTVGVTYYVRETGTIYGYEITSTDAQAVPVVFGENPISFRDNELGTIQFLKLDADTFSPIAGVDFAISTQGGADFGAHIIQTLTTDSTGYTPVSQDLIVGTTYWIAEINAPTGYDNDNATPVPVTVSFRETYFAGPFFDYQRFGAVTVQKDVVGKSGDTTPFQVRIVGDDVSYDCTVTLSQADGVISGATPGYESLGRLPYGTYTVSELSGADNYDQLGITIGGKVVTDNQFTIGDDTYGAAIAIVATNHEKLGSVSLQKQVSGKSGDTTPFDIRIQGVDVVYDHTVTLSQADGVITGATAGDEFLSQLPFGTYQVIEENVPANYDKIDITINGATVTGDQFSINGDTYGATIAIVAENRERMGQVGVQKAVQGKAGDTTPFDIRIQGVDVSYDHTVTLSQADGLITGATAGYEFLSQLPYGTYQVSEENVPANYDKLGITINGASVTGDQFTIDGDTYGSMITILALNQEKLGSITINKVMSGPYPADIAPFDFTISGSGILGGSQNFQLAASGAGSTAVFNGLSFGTYTITETSRSDFSLVSFTGGSVSGNTCTVQVGPGDAQNVTVNCTNAAKLGSITINKVMSGVYPSAIAPFDFTIYGPGIKDGSQPFQLTATGTGSTASFDNLVFGTYTIVETPRGDFSLVSYTGGTQTGNACTVQVGPGDAQHVTVTCTNAAQLGSITIQKAMSGAYPSDISPFDFTITGEGIPGGSQSFQLTATGADSSKVFDNLVFGTYKITETGRSDFHLVTFAGGGTPVGANEYDVTVGPGGNQHIVVGCVNAAELGSITLNKAMQGPYPSDIAPFEFTIAGAGIPGGSESFTLDPSGTGSTIQIGNLVFGTYTITETSRDDFNLVGFAGGSVSGNTCTVQVGPSDAQNVTVTCTNEAKLGSITINKAMQGPYNSAIAPFDFTIAGPGITGGSQNFQLTANGVGTTANFDNLVFGTYTITETSRADFSLVGFTGGSVSGNTCTVQVGPGDSQNISVTCTNSAQPGKAFVKKLSSYDDSPINNVFFQLLYAKPDSNGDVNPGDIGPTVHTNGSGIAEFDGLVVGTHYWVREVHQADNYDIDTLLAKEVVAALNPDPADAPVFKDHPLGFVNVIKYDASTANTESDNPYADAKKVGGAVYGIYDNAACSGTPVTTVTTSDSDPVMSAALPFGSDKPTTYWVKEMAPAPAGYVLSEEIKAVTFTHPGQIADFQFVDLPISTLKLIKVSALDDNAMLDGASFKLYNNADLADAHQVGVEQTTGDGGKTGFVEFDNLTFGKDYWVLETKAPKDYKLPDPNVAYKVTITKALTVFTVKDEYNPPHNFQTGTMDWNFLVIGGLALMGGALLIILSRKHRTKRVRTTHVR